jgi:hypothetical protein
MDCEQIRELLEAYALGVLDAGDAASVERHLAECADCRAALSGLQRAVSAMPLALASASPLHLNPEVKTRLMHSIEADAATRQQAGDVRMARPYSAPRLLKRLMHPRNIALAAGLLLLIVSVAWSVRLGVALAEERALRAEFASLVGQQEVVLEIVDSRNTIKRLLRSPGGSPSYGKLYTRTDMAHVVAMAARLAPPQEGYAYHLWLETGGDVELAGTMNVNAEGFGLLVLEADQVGPIYDSAWLTLQPKGSAAPSGSAIIHWNASQ